MMEELQTLMSQDIPEGRQSIKDSHSNLEKVAEYCEANYFQADNKTQALEESKRYTTQSLASVAYQINTLAFNLLHLIDLQTTQLTAVESQVNHLAQTVSIHKEKVARREIGVLTTNKNIIRQHKILAPANQERPIKYIRKPVDYTVLDGVGHSVRNGQQYPGGQAAFSQTAPRPRRNSSSSVPGPAGPAPTQKPPTPPSQQMSSNNMMGMGTMRRSDYRTPPIVAPPQLPGNYASNYSMGAGNFSTAPRRSNSSCSTLPSAQQQAIYRQTMMKEMPMGMAHGNNAAQYPPNQMMINSMAPAPPPPFAGGPGQGFQENLPAPPVTMMAPSQTQAHFPPSSDNHAVTGNVSPPLPPPPEELAATDDAANAAGPADASGNHPKWAPASYLEKVVAIYDYQADKADELSFTEHAIIYVLKKNDDGWYEGVMDGVRGLFPGNYVEPCN